MKDKISKEKVLIQMARNNLLWGDLAKRLDRSPAFLTNVFKAKHNTPKTVALFSEVLKCDPKDILLD